MSTGTQQEPLPVMWHSLDSLGRVYGRHELVVDEKSRRDGYLSARGRDGERHWLGHCVLRRMDEGGSQRVRAVSGTPGVPWVAQSGR